MTKDQFLKVLSSGIQKLPKEEQDDILQDFEEHFQIGLEEGKSEEEIVKSLGSPQQIAKELVATYHIESFNEYKSVSNVLRATWAVIGLGFFNLTIVVIPFIVIASLILAGWLTSISFLVSPLLVLINGVIFPRTFEFFELFLSITLCGLGIFTTIGMYYVTRFFSNIFVRYLKFNVNFVKGGINNV